MKKKRILILVMIALLVVGLISKDYLIRSYVVLCNDKLETYALKMLDSPEQLADSYGIWETSSNPDDRIVEFLTGGFGLAPSSTYKGFYYSEDDHHKPFSAAYKDKISMAIDEDHATWTDGTDNHGTSVRIIEKWFWFEASF